VDFRVLGRGTWPKGHGAFLVADSWDDFGFKTLFTLHYGDAAGVREIGPVKIGRMGMTSGRLTLPERFQQLDDSHFSLGQDISYYESLRDLGGGVGLLILEALHDVSLDVQRYDRVQGEDVMTTSLLRSISNALVHGQFARVARGQDTRAAFAFTYTWPLSRVGVNPPPLEFKVRPGSTPPTNMHAVIGSNGVGKTELLRNLARAIAGDGADPTQVGSVHAGTAGPPLRTSGPIFSKVIMVSFSAFDQFERFTDTTARRGADGTKFILVALDSEGIDDDLVSEEHELTSDASVASLAEPSPFSQSAEVYARRIAFGFNTARRDRWDKAIETLAADPLLEAANIILGSTTEPPGALPLFDALSSGHKIVLLAVTQLASLVAERTLVLIDEPETHLHPPLLAAFIKAVSDLLVDLNGVAIIATHSPVVLQEIPSSCAYKLRRSGDVKAAERPRVETYGENVGRLTHEVFGLEMTRTGVHRRLVEAVDEGLTFEEVIGRFGHELGIEAKAIVRALISNRDHGGGATSAG
jgi:hypothetical protein